MSLEVLTSGKCSVERIRHGFLFDHGLGLQRVRVSLNPTYWEVNSESSNGTGYAFSLVQTRTLVEHVCREPLSELKRKNGSPSNYRLQKWMFDRKIGSAAKLIYPICCDLLEKLAEPRTLGIQRKIFAANFEVHNILLHPEFYKCASEYLVDDIHKYRAAAVAVNCYGGQSSRDLLPTTNAGYSYLDSLAIARCELQNLCEKLLRWRSFYSNTGKSYPNLNHTLDRLPGGIRTLLFNLSSTKLKKVYFDRVELITLLLSLGYHNQTNSNVFEFASRADILEAMRRLSNHLGRDLSPRRTDDIATCIQYLSDYPEKHDGGVVGLVEKAVGFHHEIEQMSQFPPVLSLGENEVAPPPIPIPSIAGLRFLGTVQVIYQEGYEMEHCIASYVERAKSGSCFLFHFEEGNHTASIEVNVFGRVVQSRGPKNSENPASRKARQILSNWASKFPQPTAEMESVYYRNDAPF